MPNTIIINSRGLTEISKAKKKYWSEYGGTCAVLPQYFGCNNTSYWKQGPIVKGLKALKKGTCIATFEGKFPGKYPNRETGNHAAIYMGQNSQGIIVLEQFKGISRPQKRTLRFLDNMSNASNNGNCYSVLLTTPNRSAPGFRSFASAGVAPSWTPDSKLVINAVARGKHDKSVMESLKNRLRDEVLTYDDVKAIVTSATDRSKSGKLFNNLEFEAFNIILSKANTLDVKSRKYLQSIVNKR